MKEMIMKYLDNTSGNISIEQISLNFLVAFILGLVVYLSYKFSHSRAVYSARFNVSLIMLTIISTMVMSVIGNNIALSLGMVGALSIVRFRTAIKDPRDTIYIFWTIVNGICCGASEYIIAFIGSGTVFIVLLFLGYIKSNDRYLLIIHGERESAKEVEEKILVFYSGNAILRVKNTTINRVEYIYEISRKLIEKAKKGNENITEEIYKIKGVDMINMVCQNEDINR